MADTPYDRLRDQRASQNVQRREASRARTKKRRSRNQARQAPPPYESRRGNDNNDNNGGGKANNPFAKRWGRFNPGPYDPNVPYTGGSRGPSAQRGKAGKGLGKMLREQDPEAYAARVLGKAGIGYNPTGANLRDQYVGEQVNQALIGLRTARLDKPNLDIKRYFGRLPAWDNLSGGGLPPSANDGRRRR